MYLSTAEYNSTSLVKPNSANRICASLINTFKLKVLFLVMNTYSKQLYNKGPGVNCGLLNEPVSLQILYCMMPIPF